MPQIKFVKDYKEYRKGDTAEVTPNVAFGLIDKGVAIQHKMVTESQTKRRTRGNAS